MNVCEIHHLIRQFNVTKDGPDQGFGEPEPEPEPEPWQSRLTVSLGKQHLSPDHGALSLITAGSAVRRPQR